MQSIDTHMRYQTEKFQPWLFRKRKRERLRILRDAPCRPWNAFGECIQGILSIWSDVCVTHQHNLVRTQTIKIENKSGRRKNRRQHVEWAQDIRCAYMNALWQLLIKQLRWRYHGMSDTHCYTDMRQYEGCTVKIRSIVLIVLQRACMDYLKNRLRRPGPHTFLMSYYGYVSVINFAGITHEMWKENDDTWLRKADERWQARTQ